MNANAEIERLIVDLSTDPVNPKKNFAAAVEYERLGQTASAVGLYLRTAEYGYKSDIRVVYTALLKIANCIADQKDRQISVKNVLLQAIAYLPNRPEAHFLLSRYYEQAGSWQESYTFAELGLRYAGVRYTAIELPAFVGYYGSYCLTFQRAVSAWWIGRKDESLADFTKLSSLELAPEYAESVKQNLERLHK